MFGVLPHTIARLPLSEFQVMYRYYMKLKTKTQDHDDSYEPTDGVVIE